MLRFLLSTDRAGCSIRKQLLPVRLLPVQRLLRERLCDPDISSDRPGWFPDRSMRCGVLPAWDVLLRQLLQLLCCLLPELQERVFACAIRCVGFQFCHFFAAAYYGNAFVFYHSDDVFTVFADKKSRCLHVAYLLVL